jgi:hypothetical protein
MLPPAIEVPPNSDPQMLHGRARNHPPGTAAQKWAVLCSARLISSARFQKFDSVRQADAEMEDGFGFDEDAAQYKRKEEAKACRHRTD